MRPFQSLPPSGKSTNAAATAAADIASTASPPTDPARINPSNAKAWVGLGQAAMEIKDYRRAELALKAYQARQWSWDMQGLSLHNYTVVRWPPAFASVGFGGCFCRYGHPQRWTGRSLRPSLTPGPARPSDPGASRFAHPSEVYR